jgi:hypothetical protein
MRRAVLCQLSTHPDIREMILSTGNEEINEKIVENSPVDYYWGCGADVSGKNMLARHHFNGSTGNITSLVNTQVRNIGNSESTNIFGASRKHEEKISQNMIIFHLTLQ